MLYIYVDYCYVVANLPKIISKWFLLKSFFVMLQSYLTLELPWLHNVNNSCANDNGIQMGVVCDFTIPS